MFYETAAGHPLRHEPYSRPSSPPAPIGWNQTRWDAAGRVNLAALRPSSTAVLRPAPPHGSPFSSDGPKKDARELRARETGEFVCSLATWTLREAHEPTSPPLRPGARASFAHAGLTARALCASWRPPAGVRESPVAAQCKLLPG